MDCLKFLKELPWLLSISFVAGRQGGKDGDDEDHCTTDKLWMEEGLTNTIQITKRVIEEQSRNIFSYFLIFERLFHPKSHNIVQTLFAKWVFILPTIHYSISLNWVFDRQNILTTYNGCHHKLPLALPIAGRTPIFHK